MGTILQDLRYGVRVLLKAPGFAAVAILTLALGIGANSAMFSIVNGVLLRGLPFPEPERLVMVYTSSPQFAQMSTSYPNFLDWAERARSFEALGAFRTDSLNLTGQGQPERVRVAMVSAPFLDLLGLKPFIGRGFTADEDRRGGPLVVMLGASYWKERFGGDPGVLGQTFVMNGLAYTVVGVAPTDIAVARGIKAFVPIGGWREELFWDRSVGMGMRVVGRLRDSVAIDTARAEMARIGRDLAHEYPKENKEKSVGLVPLRDDLVGDVRPALLVLLGAVAFVLLIACVNVANLLLARAAARRREFAIRTAVGAGGSRLVRQVLTEGGLLALGGCAAGVVLARFLVKVIAARIGDDLPAHAVLGLDERVLGFTALLSIVAGVIFAAVPAWQTARADVNAALREGGRGTTGRHRVQRTLVVAEIALALLLTAAAGLMVRTMWHLWQIDPGFDPKGVLTFSLAGMPSRDPAPDALRAGYDALERRIRRVPGVESASIVAGSLPMSGDSEVPFWVVGEPHADEQSKLPWALFYTVSAEYRQAFGLTLLRGRFITPADAAKAPFVVVIDEELARSQFQSKDPIGQRLHLSIIDVEYEIVGIVRHVRHWGLDSDDTARIRSQLYLPFRQLPDAIMPMAANGSDWIVRSRLAPGVLADQIKHAVFEQNPTMTMYGVQTMEEIIDASLSQKRLARLLLGSFAILALLLAAVGIYGVMSQLVLQTTHDIGVRMAVGASSRAVLGMVLTSAMGMALAGVVAGAALTIAATRLMRGLLYGVSATDPVTFASVAALLGGVALAASLVPAWRATKVDPMVTLRYE
jgi:putative ABC transport system permease protein